MKPFDAVRTAVVLVLVAILSYLFLQSNPPWNTAGSGIAIHSVLAFLAVVASAAALGRTRIDPSPKHKIIVVALVYISAIHIGATLDYFYRIGTPVINITPADVLLDLVETTTVAVLLLLAYHMRGEDLKESSIWRKRTATPLLLVAALAFYGLVYLIDQAMPSSATVTGSGYAIWLAGVAAYTLLIMILNRQRVDWSTHDPVRLTMSIASYAASSVILLFVLSEPSQLWILSVVFQAAGLIFMVIATGYPFLVDVGVKRWIAYTIVVALTIFLVGPFVATHLIENVLSFVSYVNKGVTVLIHLNAAVFTSVVGTILYFRSRSGTSWYHSPIVFLMFSWTIIESAIVISRFSDVYGDQYEPFVAYVIGGLISAVTLLVAVRRILAPPRGERPTLSVRLHLAGYISVVIVLILGEIIKAQLFQMDPGLFGSFVGETIMLCTGFVSAFALVSFVMLMAAATGGQYSVESLAVSTQSLWIISIILKANFTYWSAGWWTAEVILLAAGVLLYLTLTYLYLDKNKEVLEFKSRTRVYSDVVGSDIVDQHVETLSLLSRMSEKTDMSESNRTLLSQAMMKISQADDLTRAMRGLVGGEPYPPKDLEPTDLVDCVKLAATRASKAMPDKRVEVKIDSETGKCFVSANGLLSDLFFSLLRGLVRRAKATLSITATTTALLQEPTPMWEIRMGTLAAKTEAKQTLDLFEHYLETDSSEGLDFALVRELTRLFLGRVHIETKEHSEELDMITFVFAFPAAELP
ncbi:MAG: hypothetical protein C4K49_12015 [Candidatus Thorarchaeota archaeon]|nr:MAG: hypothetical protein C4K49_12015 [Candidatus Thorarchaeota archaeon]